MTYLLDTDTLIFMIRGLKRSEARGEWERERLDRARRIVRHCQEAQAAGHEIALSSITVAELEYGAQRSGHYGREIAAVRKILAPFVARDFDATHAARHYGEVRHGLEAARVSVGAMDLLIAGHALALDATLITNNLAHFGRIPDLRCENWSA